jgi:hypothetical protein
VLAIVPGQTAAVFVAFAAIGATPLKSNAGNEMKLPPPATEFSAPATNAAQNRKTGWLKDTRKNNPRPRRSHAVAPYFSYVRDNIHKCVTQAVVAPKISQLRGEKALR